MIDSKSLLRQAWRKKRKKQPLLPEEESALAHYEAELEEQSARVRLDRELTRRVAKECGVQAGRFVNQVVEDVLDGRLVPVTKVEALRAAYEERIRDDQGERDEAERRRIQLRRERDQLKRERDEALAVEEWMATQLQSILDNFGAPEPEHGVIKFLGPRLTAKESKDDPEGP